MSDYRAWLKAGLVHWDANGDLEPLQRDLKAIKSALDRTMGRVSSVPKVEVRASVADVVTGKLPGSIDLTPSLAALWGWSFASLPGKRHRKLLTRAIAADHQYIAIEKRLSKVWKASA